MRTKLATVAIAATVVLAGCLGGTVSNSATTTASVDDAGGTEDNTSTVRFYISDRPAAIENFEHLNVTVSKVGFQQGGESGNWTEYDVDNRTVDLTRLRGANATMIGQLPVENGTYSKVFVHVSDVEGTLNSGEQVRVKLPSEKLQITKPFTVGTGESVDFVFDIAVHEAGQSGKYILKPVIGESGTDVPIEDVDDEGDERLTVETVGNLTRGENATVEVTRNGTAVANATVTVDEQVVGRTDTTGRLTVPIPADVEEVTIEATLGDLEGELEREFDSENETDEDEPDDDANDDGNDSTGDVTTDADTGGEN